MSLAIPLERLARPSDPETSLRAAQKATKAGRRAISAVALVMADNQPRTDQEIRLACRELADPYVASLSTIQHGRLALVEAGLLMDSGLTRPTDDGCESVCWVAA